MTYLAESLNLTRKVYSVGANMLGYLPEGDITYFEADAFDDARNALKELIGRDLEAAEDADTDGVELPIGNPDDLAEAIAEVEVWHEPDMVVVGSVAYWIGTCTADQTDIDADQE